MCGGSGPALQIAVNQERQQHRSAKDKRAIFTQFLILFGAVARVLHPMLASHNSLK
jgi:hypothetical protein